MVFRLLMSVALVSVMAACSSPKQAYMVDIKNATNEPLSVGLIKSDGSAEDGWTSPEHIAINAPQLGDRKWGKLVPPGQVRTIGPQAGSFATGSHGILRVYAGDATVDELIAYGRTDPGRLDIHLWPGQSGYMVEMRNGRLTAKPIETDGRR
ncbi:MAG TPA: hypothetical protein VHP11_10495 [Tepidisphaeraceae bacterium]|nr:hypothetical protein [Tepidisphaeraceae bacterium]